MIAVSLNSSRESFVMSKNDAIIDMFNVLPNLRGLVISVTSLPRDKKSWIINDLSTT